MAQKRPSSPLPIQSCKRAELSDESNTIIQNGNSQESIRMILQKVLTKQVELVQQLVFKDAECQKLKKKFDEVDRNCRKWHDFAIGLQSRVKRLALILHRQQDSMKSLKNKGVHSAETAVQTDSGIFQQMQSSTCLACKKEESKGDTIAGCGRDFAFFQSVGNLTSAKTIPKIKDGTHIPAKSETGEEVASSVVIDLTDEETMKNCLLGAGNRLKSFSTRADEISSVKPAQHSSVNFNDRCLSIMRGQGQSQSRSMRNSLHKPLAPVQPISTSFANSQLRQVNPVAPLSSTSLSPKPKINSQKDHIALMKDNLLRQRSPSLFTPQVKVNGDCVAPYPPLPPMPLPPPGLPKNIPSLPAQPLLRIRKSKDGIELSWDHAIVTRQAKMDCYELFVFQHNPSSHSSNRWKKIGNDPIKAMPLPMACTLSQFSSGSKYYFAVRGKDVYGRCGTFSAPCCSTDVQ